MSFIWHLVPHSTRSNIALLVAHWCVSSPLGRACSTSSHFAKWTDPGLCGGALKDTLQLWTRRLDSGFLFQAGGSPAVRFSSAWWQVSRAGCSSSGSITTATAEAESRRWALGGGGVTEPSCIATKPPSSASIIQWILKPQCRWIGCHLVVLLHSHTWTHI